MNADVIEQPTNSPRLRGKPSAAKSWLKAIELTSRIETDPRRLFADVVEDWSKRQPDRPALISQAGTFGYRTLAERINRYARWALSAGIEAGDTVCLLMPSRPDYIAARHHQGRRRGRADQYQAGRAVAVSLHQCR
jgi:Acyl-CoA synthetases (AMP-forming)/AMP-acid ligases II